MPRFDAALARKRRYEQNSKLRTFEKWRSAKAAKKRKPSMRSRSFIGTMKVIPSVSLELTEAVANKTVARHLCHLRHLHHLDIMKHR